MLGFGNRQETTTTGTGNLTLSSVSGYPTLNDVFGTNVRFWYSILDSSNKPIECGYGYLSDSTTLVRELVLATFASGTYDNTAPAAVSLAAGTKRVMGSPAPTALGSAIPQIAGGFASSTIKAQPAHINSSLIINSSVPVTDRLYVWPFKLEFGGESTGIELSIQTAEAAKNAKVALYGVAGDGWAGKRLAETANISVATTGLKAQAWGANVHLPPGWYYMAVTTDGTTMQWWGPGSNLNQVIATPLGIISNDRPVASAFKAIGTTLTFPDPMDAESGFTPSNGNGNIPTVHLKFA